MTRLAGTTKIQEQLEKILPLYINNKHIKKNVNVLKLIGNLYVKLTDRILKELIPIDTKMAVL